MEHLEQFKAISDAVKAAYIRKYGYTGGWRFGGEIRTDETGPYCVYFAERMGKTVRLGSVGFRSLYQAPEYHVDYMKTNFPKPSKKH